eukprot:3149229-Alexandrium_andersonii.AAC.1
MLAVSPVELTGRPAAALAFGGREGLGHEKGLAIWSRARALCMRAASVAWKPRDKRALAAAQGDVRQEKRALAAAQG